MAAIAQTVEDSLENERPTIKVAIAAAAPGAVISDRNGDIMIDESFVNKSDRIQER